VALWLERAKRTGVKKFENFSGILQDFKMNFLLDIETKEFAS
jgi:hypothetical protein